MSQNKTQHPHKTSPKTQHSSKPKQKKTRQEINEESRELKRKRKRKGLPSGSRFNDAGQSHNNKSQQVQADPRIGSKKPISLTASDDANLTVKNERQTVSISEQQQGGATSFMKSNKTKGGDLVDDNVTTATKKQAEDELTRLENDAKLNQLFDMVEANKDLSDEQMTYLNSKLDRIDVLMEKLGYSDDDFDGSDDSKAASSSTRIDIDLDSAAEKKEDIVGLLKRK